MLAKNPVTSPLFLAMWSTIGLMLRRNGSKASSTGGKFPRIRLKAGRPFSEGVDDLLELAEEAIELRSELVERGERRAHRRRRGLQLAHDRSGVIAEVGQLGQHHAALALEARQPLEDLGDVVVAIGRDGEEARGSR